MKVDIKQHVTDTIIAQIEAGTPPWRKPWASEGAGAALPLRHNGTPYRGVNILMLWASAQMQGFNSPRWMTFRQAKELGGTVRKGEKATRSVFYGTYEREGDDGEQDTRTSRFAKVNNVFCADQIDGLPEEFYVRPAPPTDFGADPVAEFDAFFAATGATLITSSKAQAYYCPQSDHIHMPPIAIFENATRYYSVLGHEHCHWAFSERRLDIQKAVETKREYAFHELCAEIGASMLAVHLGLTPDFAQSAAYLGSWLKMLKADKDAIFKAASQAQKALDYITAQATKSGELVAA